MMSEESKELLQVVINLMKRLEREKTVLPSSGSTNQWINEVGVVSKQLKEHKLYYIKVIGNHWKNYVDVMHCLVTYASCHF